MNSQTRRSYFAQTVEAAVAQARLELGDDALLVESRRISGQEQGSAGYEVLFDSAGAERPETPAASLDTSGLIEQVAGLKRDLARMNALLRHLAAAAYRSDAALAPVAARLGDLGFPPELSSELLFQIERRLGRAHHREVPSERDIQRTLAAELESRLQVSPGVGRDAAARKIVVLVGPPGSGKTTTLAKLAVVAGVSQGLPAAIISTDSFRVAAADQLRSYAAILGLPFDCAETPGDLLRCLDAHRNKRLLLIDTPGYGPGEADLAAEWARLFRSRSEIEVQLVLNASTRFRDMESALAFWSSYSPSRLIFTRLDEAAGCGGILALAMNSALPVSFLCAGQAVPEDIEPAAISRLVAFAMQEEPAARAATA
jgi:flagellar biosynthesis protein FlhF